MSTPTMSTRLAAMPAGLVDVHTHAIDPDLVDVNATHLGTFPTVERLSGGRARIHIGGVVYRDIDERSWSASARLRDMDAEGVAAQLLSPVPVTLCHGEPAEGAETLARAQNDFSARLAAEAPDRFFALAAVPLQDPGRAIAELRRCITELGFVGVEIGTRVGNRELTDPDFLPFFRAAAELSAFVLMHPVDRTLDPRLARLGVGFGLGMPTETATAAAGLIVSGIFDAVPGLCVCLAHGGGALPAVLPRLAFGQQILGQVDTDGQLATDTARSLWCDSLTYDVDSLLLAMTRFGEDHVLLGTDYPFSARETPAGAVLMADPERLPATVARGIGRENSVSLLTQIDQLRTRLTQ